MLASLQTSSSPWARFAGVTIIALAAVLALVRSIHRSPQSKEQPMGVRLLATCCHWGVPFGSVLLPLAIWFGAPRQPFAREHAQRAVSFQLVYLPFHLLGVGFLVAGRTGPLLVFMALAFVLEVPQMVRALRGQSPFRMPPFDVVR